MIARDLGNRLNFGRLEPTKASITDEVSGVLVVVFVADVDADVMEQGAVFEPLTLARSEAMQVGRLVEYRE